MRVCLAHAGCWSCWFLGIRDWLARSVTVRTVGLRSTGWVLGMKISLSFGPRGPWFQWISRIWALPLAGEAIPSACAFTESSNSSVAHLLLVSPPEGTKKDDVGLNLILGCLVGPVVFRPSAFCTWVEGAAGSCAVSSRWILVRWRLGRWSGGFRGGLFHDEGVHIVWP